MSAYEDFYSDRVRVRPYHEADLYLHGTPNGIAVGTPAMEISLSDDDGNQMRIKANAATIHDLRLALARAERWMEKNS